MTPTPALLRPNLRWARQCFLGCLVLAAIPTGPAQAQSGENKSETGRDAPQNSQVPLDPETASSGDVYAGTGQSGKGMPIDAAARSPGQTPLGNPFGVESVREGEILLTSVDESVVWRVDTKSNAMRPVAGNGVVGYSGDGGPATRASMNWPHEVRVDAEGNLYIADTRNHVIRFVDAESGIIKTLAGNGKPGYAGDGSSGNDVRFDQPHSVVLDGDGGLIVADTKNHRLRRIDLKSGLVTTIAGTGKPKLPTDGALASSTTLFGPRSLAVDKASIWLVLREGNSVWRLDRKTGTIHHVAGTGKKGYSGDGGPPLKATFRGPKGIAVDGLGRLLVVDTENHAVRRIDLPANRIETVAGLDRHGSMKRPHGIAPFGPSGFLVADSENHVVLFGK